jgi:signal transduction histidine kinase
VSGNQAHEWLTDRNRDIRDMNLEMTDRQNSDRQSTDLRSTDRRTKFWLAAVAAMLFVLIAAALVLPRSFRLTALGDIVQSLILLSGALAFIPLAVRAQGRIRLFWSLTALGMFFWLGYQLFWVYNEVLVRRDVPDLSTWDAVLFLHLTPLMAAIALRPHIMRDEHSTRVGRLDFALLLVWWFYVYMLIVMPWQYVVPDIPAYNRNLNWVYVAEKVFLLGGLLLCWFVSKGEWRKLYASLFGMNLCYALSSTLCNWAIARKAYYTGSLYDIPLVISMAWPTWIALRSKADQPDVDGRDGSTIYGVWIARGSMIAVFSLPLFAAWTISDLHVPSRIRVFRLSLTLLAAFCMGIMVLVRQQLLDRELLRLLGHSRDSFDHLKRLQAQILQSEKLASIGQLVGGAAHELNNPITAMLGYSDLLLNTPLTEEQKPLATKIGQHVRHTKSLVASLISFARQARAPKTLLDLNTLARTAVKFAQPQWTTLDIEIRTQLDPALPKVLGDSNQLLQVCQQLVGNCLHVMSEHRGKKITVSTESRGELCVLQIAAQITPAPDSSSPAAPEESLGMSACRAILQEHRGRVLHQLEKGVLRLRVELPAADSFAMIAKESAMPAPWQSRPYA